MRGSTHHIFWWEQEFDLDLQEMIDLSGSDGSTASVESDSLWGSGLGG